MPEAAAVENNDVIMPTKADMEATLSAEGGGEDPDNDDTAPLGDVELSETEQQAYDKGWRSEAEFKGDEGTWIDAKEFVGRQPLYDGLSKQSKRIKALESVVKTITDQAAETEKTAMDRAKAQLKAKRVQAHKDEDYDRVVELEDEQRAIEAKEVAAEPEVPPEFIDWREDNDWYGSNVDATMFADAYAQQLNSTEHGLSIAQFYKQVGEHVKEKMPQEFGGKLPNRGNPPSSKGAGRKKAGVGFAQLTDDQKKVCREYEQMGIMTKEKYIAELDAMGLIET